MFADVMSQLLAGAGSVMLISMASFTFKAWRSIIRVESTVLPWFQPPTPEEQMRGIADRTIPTQVRELTSQFEMNTIDIRSDLGAYRKMIDEDMADLHAGQCEQINRLDVIERTVGFSKNGQR